MNPPLCQDCPAPADYEVEIIAPPGQPARYYCLAHYPDNQPDGWHGFPAQHLVAHALTPAARRLRSWMLSRA